MDKTIEIRVTNSAIAGAGSELTARAMIYDQCVAAGMPVQLTPFTGEIRVLRGTLTTQELFESDALCIRWEPWEPPPEPAPAPPSMWSRVKHIAERIWNA